MKTHGRTQAHDCTCIGMEATGTKIPGEPEHTSYRKATGTVYWAP